MSAEALGPSTNLELPFCTLSWYLVVFSSRVSCDPACLFSGIECCSCGPVVYKMPAAARILYVSGGESLEESAVTVRDTYRLVKGEESSRAQGSKFTVLLS
jgi:hypothetical protein